MRLSKKQIADLKAHQDVLKTEREGLVAYFQALLSNVKALEEFYNSAVRAHNESIDKAKEFVSDIADELTADYDEKTDRWKESDAGQAAEDLASQWQNAELDHVEEVHFVAPDPPHFNESLNMDTEPNV